MGAALIGLGAVPSRLRAKGYGATVSVSAANRIKLKLKSERRVGLHAIAEICTQGGVEFEQAHSDFGESVLATLRPLAELLEKPSNSSIRLSVEGHTDDVGEAQDNAKLSVARAQSVVKSLVSLSVDASRLVAHGFGHTLPIEDNTSAEGRQRNRRVQFLVIPDVTKESK